MTGNKLRYGGINLTVVELTFEKQAKTSTEEFEYLTREVT